MHSAEQAQAAGVAAVTLAGAVAPMLPELQKRPGPQRAPLSLLPHRAEASLWSRVLHVAG